MQIACDHSGAVDQVQCKCEPSKQQRANPSDAWCPCRLVLGVSLSARGLVFMLQAIYCCFFATHFI